MLALIGNKHKCGNVTEFSYNTQYKSSQNNISVDETCLIGICKHPKKLIELGWTWKLSQESKLSQKNQIV